MDARNFQMAIEGPAEYAQSPHPRDGACFVVPYGSNERFHRREILKQLIPSVCSMLATAK
jgi:hypothetical protein